MKAWLEYHQCQVEAGELDIAGRGVDMTEYSRKSKLSLSNMVGLPRGSVVKNPPANAEGTGSIPGSGRPLEKEMATYDSILAWEIPWTEESGRLQSMGLQKSQT